MDATALMTANDTLTYKEDITTKRTRHLLRSTFSSTTWSYDQEDVLVDGATAGASERIWRGITGRIHPPGHFRHKVISSIAASPQNIWLKLQADLRNIRQLQLSSIVT
uniref:Uncharacterized protein n=1 Tax=Romanomermis culicivorax TaxID=13658 RepID=A0A915LA56_ROMCU